MGSIKHNLKAIYTIWLRELLRFIREPARVIGSLGGPLLFLFVLGGGLASSMPGFGGAPGNFDFRQFMFPGVLAMGVLFTAIFSGISIVWDREFGFLKEVLVAPVSRTAIALGKIAGGSTVAMIQGAIILFLGPLIGVDMSIGQIVTLLGLMLVLAAVMSALGVMIAARQRSTEGFQFIMQFLVLPMFFLSGALFPLTDLPLWMTWLARIDPVTYGVDAMRNTALSGTVPGQVLQALILHPIALNLLIMFAFGIIFLIPAVWLFNIQD
jgi:ABC-2 type transport system permease protein